MGDLPAPAAATAATNKSNKITDIVRLHQMLKKWKQKATSSKTTTKTINKLLKKTLSFSDISTTPQQQDHNHNTTNPTTTASSNNKNNVVPKGYLAVWVGREEEGMKKFVIPTDYLAHQAFSLLLREAEEEFGFQQEGILRIPCHVPFFEKILKMMPDPKRQRSSLKTSSSSSSFFLYEHGHQQVPTQQQQQEPVNYCSPADLRQNSPSFDTHPTTTTTPSHHLQLPCR